MVRARLRREKRYAARMEIAAPPPAAVVDDEELLPLVVLLAGRRTAALTGAGVSTESGIPGYRGEGAPPRARPPLRIQELTTDAHGQRRYWARAFLGWPRMNRAAPNAAHVALAVLERAGALLGVVTQNVDGLHRRAGSRRLVELHGALADVLCVGCGHSERRADVHARFEAANPGFERAAFSLLPDGDAELPDAVIERFVLVACRRCGGVLRPGVVFFGEHVPRVRAGEANALVDEAGALLVVGSSLEVDSGLRLVRRARARGLPIAVVNRGPSKADALATVRIDARAGDVLPRLAQALSSS